MKVTEPIKYYLWLIVSYIKNWTICGEKAHCRRKMYQSCYAPQKSPSEDEMRLKMSTHVHLMYYLCRRWRMFIQFVIMHILVSYYKIRFTPVKNLLHINHQTYIRYIQLYHTSYISAPIYTLMRFSITRRINSLYIERYV